MAVSCYPTWVKTNKISESETIHTAYFGSATNGAGAFIMYCRFNHASSNIIERTDNHLYLLGLSLRTTNTVTNTLANRPLYPFLAIGMLQFSEITGYYDVAIITEETCETAPGSTQYMSLPEYNNLNLLLGKPRQSGSAIEIYCDNTNGSWWATINFLETLKKPEPTKVIEQRAYPRYIRTKGEFR